MKVGKKSFMAEAAFELQFGWKWAIGHFKVREESKHRPRAHHVEDRHKGKDHAEPL